MEKFPGSTSENKSAEPEVQVDGGPDRVVAKSSNLFLAILLPFFTFGVFDGFFHIVFKNDFNID